MIDSALRLIGITKDYGNTRAVSSLHLDVAEGEFVTLLGPSGCGKTTTLSLIAGFFPPTEGEIWLNGRSVEKLPPFRRDIGVVFQDYALFPHMTTAENVAFGLRMRRVPKAEIERRVTEALDLVQLRGFADRRPLQLSGGQRQRVALARALVIQPDLLLLDEPLSNLDLKLREEMRVEIANLQRKLGITTIFVTHDQSEALVMSDRVVVMNKSYIEQIGTPSEIYERPSSRFVASFIGRMNFFTGRVERNGGGPALVRLDSGQSIAAPLSADLPTGSVVHLAIRPERAQLASAPPAAPETLAVPARISNVLYLGAHHEVHLEMASGDRGLVEIPNDGATESIGGTEVYFTAPFADCLVLPADSQG